MLNQIGSNRLKLPTISQDKDLLLKNINHVALLIDGHRRWARRHGFEIRRGYEKAVEILPSLVEYCWKRGIHTVTVWILTTDNISKRPADQLEVIYSLCDKLLASIVDISKENQAKIIHLGRKDRVTSSLAKKIMEAEEVTSKFGKHIFNAAIDYSSRGEIMHMINNILATGVSKDELSDELISKFVYTNNQPYPSPDIIIRPGDVVRLSGFMSWDSSSSELFFSDKFFPDFTENDLENVFQQFQLRQRRFGA